MFELKKLSSPGLSRMILGRVEFLYGSGNSNELFFYIALLKTGILTRACSNRTISFETFIEKKFLLCATISMDC